MPILSAESKQRDIKKIVFIGVPLLAIISGLLVVHFVFHVDFFRRDTKDPNFGKYAYSTWNGQYLGKIEGWKSSTDEWIIKQPTGSNIPMSKFRVEVSDTPPGMPDDSGKSYKSTSGKPPNH